MKNQRGSALQDTPRRFSKEARLSHHSEYSRPRRPGAQQPSVQRSLLRPIEKMLQFAVEKNMCQQKEQSVRHSLNAEGSSPEGSGCLSSESKLSHHRQGRVTACCSAVVPYTLQPFQSYESTKPSRDLHNATCQSVVCRDAARQSRRGAHRGLHLQLP